MTSATPRYLIRVRLYAAVTQPPLSSPVYSGEFIVHPGASLLQVMLAVRAIARAATGFDGSFGKATIDTLDARDADVARGVEELRIRPL